MKLVQLSILALSLLVPTGFAATECGCNKSCQKLCVQEENNQCKCECGCKETGICEHGKCHQDHSGSEKDEEHSE